MDPDGTGVSDLEEADGYRQQTALFDKGELLGELAELESPAEVPGTRHDVEAEEAPRGCRLIVVAGPDLGVEWAFKKDQITIGRAAEHDLDFPDIAVSRDHARISREGSTFYLTDLSSDNGTHLNGVKIEHEALASGDEILIGARTLRFVELTDAPPTAAAHPVLDRGPVPVIGSAVHDALDGGDNPAGQIDVGVVADADEPKVGSLPAPAKPSPEAAPAKASWVKLLSAVVAALLLVGGLGYLAKEVYLRLTGNTPEQRLMRARSDFLQGVELVKLRRFGDALVFFDQVLVLRPEYVRAKEYREHSQQEIAVWRVLEEGKVLLHEERWDEALAKLDPLNPLTAWQPEVEAAKRVAHRALAEARAQEARGLFEAGEKELALTLVEEALLESPGLPAALALKQRIEALKAPKVEPTERPKPQPQTPPELEPAVHLYISDRISAAIDAAEAAGGPNAVVYIERMKQMQALLSELDDAHRNKAAGDVLRLAPEALKLDDSIAHGAGQVRARLRDAYADGLYLKALDAQQDEDLVRASQLLHQALKIRPGHKLSESQVTELQQKAKELYYQGYAVKDTDPDQAKKLFRQVIVLARPDSQIHQWASAWLSSNGG